MKVIKYKYSHTSLMILLESKVNISLQYKHKIIIKLIETKTEQKIYKMRKTNYVSLYTNYAVHFCLKAQKYAKGISRYFRELKYLGFTPGCKPKIILPVIIKRRALCKASQISSKPP